VQISNRPNETSSLPRAREFAREREADNSRRLAIPSESYQRALTEPTLISINTPGRNASSRG
jgi:hypothetical protein